jgi:hypothetical protein
MDKPYGMISTLELQFLKEPEECKKYDIDIWGELQAVHKFDSSDVYIDERSGEIICELFGSLTEKRYW